MTVVAAQNSLPKLELVLLREAAGMFLVPVRGYAKGCSLENIEFVGIAA
jgi:hypothetical protein